MTGVSMPAGLPAVAREFAESLRAHGFDPERAADRQVMCLAEEVGEFVGAYRRFTGQARRTGTAEEVRDELADVVLAAFVAAYELGIDLAAAIEDKTHTIRARGWRTR
ncbi:MazG nucleotide pyrophosphohydrolase domain-containing protein [Saccharothrix sp.]|uniref:MazG nucleotide pyrophosphohydrolase domain-containing protein n=1 Tax=Saccharothrix sp. TaxID=1873460 RepID=UPI002812197B|nr:MazG nucleotide pyrophosphohydrolase domain-containing protein [Saccharothrix sp.]